jgi:hypothetical protein
VREAGSGHDFTYRDATIFRRSGAKRTRRRDQPDSLREGLLERPVSDEGLDNDVLIDKGEQGDSDVPEIIGEDIEVERET